MAIVINRQGDTEGEWVDAPKYTTLKPRAYDYIQGKIEALIQETIYHFKEIDHRMNSYCEGRALFLDIGGGLYQMVCVKGIKDKQSGELMVSYATNDPDQPVEEKVVCVLDLYTERQVRMLLAANKEGK